MKNPHKYRDLDPDGIEELFSNFLIDSWSFSKVSSFARNEKAFEMQSIYRVPYYKSATAVAGSAYHKALEYYFNSARIGDLKDITDLQIVAFDYINSISANFWKLQKTTPTIEHCQIKATKTATVLLENFFAEISIYESEIKEILQVEIYCDEFLTLNGVDIALPCHAVIDLVFKTHDDRIIILDHKSKAKFSDEKELKFSIGTQGITYVNCYESFSGNKVDQIWFVENKISKNRDNSPQLNCFKIDVNPETKKLYESLLYEPLRRMLGAVSDPDYVYLINESDNFVDKAEIYDFWCRTMVAEIEDFPLIPENKKDLISKRLRKIRDASLASVDPKIIKKFKEDASAFITYDLTNKNMTKEQKIEHTMRTLGMPVEVAHTFDGYSSDTFLLNMSKGINLSKIHRYKLDLAHALNVSSIRMNKDLFVHDGKSYLCLEASKKRDKDLMFDSSYLVDQKIPIGLDNFNQPVIWDLENPSTPHVLICGATGSGKSVAIISIVEYGKLAGVDNIVIFDPKFEFINYSSNGVEVYNDIEDIETMMECLVEQMNELVKSGQKRKTLVVFDEFADAVSASKKGAALDIKEMVQVGEYAPKKGPMGLMMAPEPKMKLKTVNRKKSLEENLKVLLQKGRSSGFRIIAATQRASVKVITGDAKVNFPVQICFRVPKEIDSQVVLGEPGAESLAGKGDGLINSPEYMGLVRFQSFYKN